MSYRLVKVLRKDGSVKEIKVNPNSFNSEKITIDDYDYYIPAQAVFEETRGSLFKKKIKTAYVLEGNPKPISWSTPDYSLDKILQSKIDSDLFNKLEKNKAELILWAILGSVIGLLLGFILGHDVFTNTNNYRIVRVVGAIIWNLIKWKKRKLMT